MKKGVCVALVSLALVAAGCAFAAGAGAVTAGVIYVQGEAKKVYPAGVEDTLRATEAAMDSMSIPIHERKREGEGWYLLARRPMDYTEVHVHIKPRGDTASEVGVRVGLTGDRVYSERLLEDIGKRLS